MAVPEGWAFLMSEVLLQRTEGFCENFGRKFGQNMSEQDVFVPSNSLQTTKILAPICEANWVEGIYKFPSEVYSRCCIRICSAMVGVPYRPLLP